MTKTPPDSIIYAIEVVPCKVYTGGEHYKRSTQMKKGRRISGNFIPRVRVRHLAAGLGITLLIINMSFLCMAAEFEVPLWQGAAPGSEKSVMVETHKDREISDGTDTTRDRSTKGVTKPTITVCLPEKGEGKVAAVLVCPGGGFSHLAIDKEGHDIARWLVSQGIAGIVLKYRMPDPDVGVYVYNGCVEDMHRALRLIRHNADEWKIEADKIGVMGFSAGGYLAALAGVNHEDGDPAADDLVERNSCRPDFITPVYPLISLSQHSQRNPERVERMLGPSPGESTIALYSPEKQVSANTPPTFIVHANDDRLSSEHSVVFYTALRRADVPAELHIYSTGGHGFGIRSRGLPVSDWKDRWLEWMAARGLFSRQKQ